MQEKRMYQAARVLAAYYCSLPPSVRKDLVDIYFEKSDEDYVMKESNDSVFDTLDRIDELMAEYRGRQTAGITK